MKQSKTAGKRIRRLASVSLSLFLMFLGVVGYMAWQGWHQGKELEEQGAKQKKVLLALESRLTSIEAQQKQLSESLRDIKELSSWQNRDWVLSEVHYLLDLASLSLQLQHNISSAIQLLIFADNRLVLVKDPSLLPLRKAIATDKQHLQNVKVVDVPGLLMKIQALSQAMNTLSLLPVSKAISTPTASPASEKTHRASHGWRSVFQKTGQQLRALVIIEKKATLSQGALAPIEHAYNNLYVQTLLAQLQWAVLQSNDAFYQSTIQSLQTYVAHHYLQQSQAIVGLQKTMMDLGAVHLNPAYIDIKATLAALKAVMHSGGSAQHD